jgi:protein TonB
VLADLEAENDAPTPVFTSYKEPQKKGGRGSMVALLFLLLAGGGLYAAWMYQPGFREMAQPQIDRVLALIPMSHPAQSTGQVRQGSAPKPVPSAATQAPVTTSTPLPSSSAGDTPDGSISPPASSKDAPGSDQQTSTAAVPAPDSGAETTPAPPDANKKGDTKKNVLAAIPSDTELPGEKTAVILSSQGAEKRLVHHVQPAYPADARREHLEGTVILKAVVDENGKVEGVRLVEGNPTLAAAAIGAVKQWRYRPYLRDGQPRPFKTVVLVDFQRR